MLRKLGLALSLTLAVFVSAKTASAADPEPDELEQTTQREAWRRRYEEARAKLQDGSFADAAVRFAELEASATNDVDRALARSQRSLADDWTAKNLTFSKPAELTRPPQRLVLSNRRSTDEMATLYITSATYGLGTGIWLGALTDPDTKMGAILPAVVFGVLTPGVVGALDQADAFHYGSAQAVTSGTWLGLGQGTLWGMWANQRDDFTFGKRLDDKDTATLVWGVSTAGAALGALFGNVLETTPGRSSWAGSLGIWTGSLLGLATGALDDNASTGLATGAVTSNVGAIIGMLTAGAVSPPISRVRYIDLSTLGGGVSFCLLYLLGANNNSEGGAAAGVTAVGVAAGFTVGLISTTAIPKDPLHTQPTTGFLDRMRPSFMQAPALPDAGLVRMGGAMIGLSGTLD